MDPILNGPMFVGAWTSLAIASIGVFSRANHICLFHDDMWPPPRWTPHAYAFVLLFLPLICSIRLLSSSTISFSFFLPHIGTHFGVDARACATRHRLGSGSVRRHRRCRCWAHRRCPTWIGLLTTNNLQASVQAVCPSVSVTSYFTLHLFHTHTRIQ